MDSFPSFPHVSWGVSFLEENTFLRLCETIYTPLEQGGSDFYTTTEEQDFYQFQLLFPPSAN